MKSIIFSILIIAVLCFGTTEIFAQCSCEPNLTVQEQFQRSDAVFVGKVVEAKKIYQENTDSYEVLIKFEVTQTWKNDLEKFVTVRELSGGTNGFQPNAEWLLYAFKVNDGTLQIFRNCCSRTKPLSVATKQGDLKAFKKMGEKPKKIIEAGSENIVNTPFLRFCPQKSDRDKGEYEYVSGQVRSRVDMLARYQTSNDYDKMFDLMRFEEKVTRDEFIRSEKSSEEIVRSRTEVGYCEFAGFRTDDISILEPDREYALVSGCITCKKGSETIFFQGQAESVFTDNNWFFKGSIVGNTGDGIVPCKKLIIQ